MTINRIIPGHRERFQTGAELRVVLGGHWSNRPDWLILTKAEQDITQSLKFEDSSVDVIFTEHVLEHLRLSDAIEFFHESLRVLKTGGIFRVVCPMIEKLLSEQLEGQDGNTYAEAALVPCFAPELAALERAGVSGIQEARQTFFLNSLFRLHGHEFIWSRTLLTKTLLAIGFSRVSEYDVGQGERQEYCIERRMRGIYNGNDWRSDLAAGRVYDPESLVVEGTK